MILGIRPCGVSAAVSKYFAVFEQKLADDWPALLRKGIIYSLKGA